MYVVSNATPLHYLLLINQIELLAELYGSIAIPASVIAELSAVRTPRLVRDWVSQVPPWASVVSLPGPAKQLFAGLGPGEAEALTLAGDRDDSIVLTDDAQARVAARLAGIQTVPTIRILATASALSLVDFDDALKRLRRTNFRVSQRVIDSIGGRLPIK